MIPNAHLVTDLESKIKDGQVRVRMLKHVGQFSPGDVVDCEEDTAKVLCQVTHVHNGTEPVPTAKAMTLAASDAASQSARENIDQLTVGEMTQMGVKNTTQTPRDPQFEQSLKIAADAAEDAQREKADMLAAKKASKKNKSNKKLAEATA